MHASNTHKYQTKQKHMHYEEVTPGPDEPKSVHTYMMFWMHLQHQIGHAKDREAGEVNKNILRAQVPVAEDKVVVWQPLHI